MVAYEAISSLAKQCQMIIIAGNHDVADREGNVHLLSLLSPFAAVVATKKAAFILDGRKIQCLPYTEDQDRLKCFLDDTTRGDIVLMHQGISGVPVSSRGFTLNEILTPDMVPDHVACAFAGHYHSYRRVKDNLYIPGSAMQLTWADAGEKRGWLDVTIDDNSTPHVTFVRSQAPEFIEIDFLGVNPGILALNEVASNNFVRVKNWPDDTNEIRKHVLDSGARSVEVVPQEVESTKITRQDFASFIELFTEYTDVNGIEGRTLEVGWQLMKGNYATVVSTGS